MATITLYHYTSNAGAQGIQSSKRISASQQQAGGGGDAFFGSGVYLTSIAPHDTTQLKILLNNWDGPHTPSALEKIIVANTGKQLTKKIEKVVVVKLPRGLAKKVPDERDIYLVEGDIDLTKYEFSVVDGPQIAW